MHHESRGIKTVTDLDPSWQYTTIFTVGDNVMGRARDEEGRSIYIDKPYTPTYYVESPTGAEKALNGLTLAPKTFGMVSETHQAIDNHKGAVHGNIQAQYIYLSDVYGKRDVPFDIEKLYIYDIDIEVESIEGFSTPEEAKYPVISIAVIWKHLGKRGILVYGTGDYEAKPDEIYIKCESEKDLLAQFIRDYAGGGDYPDVITGWNCQFYDIPYLVNRCKKVLSSKIWHKLSPFNRLTTRTATFLNNKDQAVVDILGVTILDYYELYRKFTYTQRESYKLDHIAHVELGRRKTSYEEYRSLHQLYAQDHQLFITYNINDTKLVEELDSRLKLIELVCALAYGAKSNFTDTFKQVRLWDIMIYHYLRQNGIQIPPRGQYEKDTQYTGAYVKEPILGAHQWVCSFDIASMYPHIIREWNLSPETLRKDCYERYMLGGGCINDLLSKKEVLNGQKNDVAIAANGVTTRRDIEGFLPQIVRVLYDERVRYRNLEQQAKKDIIVAEAEKTEGWEERVAQLKKDASAYHNQQLVRKINLNSLYGGLGSNYARYYDIDMAEAITITGQYIIRRVASDLNRFLNKMLETGEKDFCIASDTDSVLLTLHDVVTEYRAVKPDASTSDIVTALDAFCKKKLEPIIKKTFDDIAVYMNVHSNCLSMKREVIADKGIWTAKKHYILRVWDSEGVRYNKPEMKIMGIEAVKSSTPAICREGMLKAIDILMGGTQEELWDYVKGVKHEFMHAPFESVASPRSVNGLKEYSFSDKSIPIHTFGAMKFNAMLEKSPNTAYTPIRDGNKIRFAYLKEPNPFQSHVMSAVEDCPKAWMIETYLDYHKQFDTTFLRPLNVLLHAAGWTAEHEVSLFD